MGPTAAYHFNNPQDAWDSIKDSAAENPYIISLEPGIYEREAIAVGFPAWWFKGKTDISVVGSRQAVVRKIAGASGGTIAIGAVDEIAERIRLSGFTVVNPLTGAGGAQGAAPEGAIYIGEEEEYPDTLPYNDIELENMHIIGSHDALQMFGTDTTGPNIPPRIFLRNNFIESHHDAVTIKGNMQVQSCSNQIFVKTNESLGNYLPSTSGWKSTGFHFNCARGTSGGNDRGAAYFRSAGDQIVVVGNGSNNFGGDQSQCCGIYVYNGSGIYSVTFNGCSIKVIGIADSDIDNGLNGIAFFQGKSLSGDFVFSNGSIDVHQQHAGSSAPAEANGVKLQQSLGDDQVVRIVDTYIRVRNDKSASPLAYSMNSIDQAENIIEHKGIVAIAADGTNTAGGGLITNIAEVA